MVFFFFFFNDTATTEIYTLSLHDALPISGLLDRPQPEVPVHHGGGAHDHAGGPGLPDPDEVLNGPDRSEEHTSELQSRQYLVCRLLLEKKKITHTSLYTCTLQSLHSTFTS